MSDRLGDSMATRVEPRGLEAALGPGAVHGPEREFTVEARSHRAMVVRRFLRHRMAVVSLAVLTLIVVVSLFGGRAWRYDYQATRTGLSNQAPTWEHPLGTDDEGHDVLAQVLRGSQKSVQIMLLVAFLSTAIGVAIGAIAGFYRGAVEWLLMRMVDLILTVPLLAILAVLSKVAQRSGSWYFIAIVLGAFVWTQVARVVRAEILSLREKEFVEAARALGATNRRIIFKHLLPNVTGSIIVSATLTMATAILLETALSFLGLGIAAPDTSLGLLVSDGANASRTRPWLFYFPGLVIILIVMCVNFIGDGLRDAFDPKQTRVRA